MIFSVLVRLFVRFLSAARNTISSQKFRNRYSRTTFSILRYACGNFKNLHEMMKAVRPSQFLSRVVVLGNGRYLCAVPMRVSTETSRDILMNCRKDKIGGGADFVGNSSKVACHFQEGLPKEEIETADSGFQKMFLFLVLPIQGFAVILFSNG